jgi:hypothetical protein
VVYYDRDCSYFLVYANEMLHLIRAILGTAIEFCSHFGLEPHGFNCDVMCSDPNLIVILNLILAEARK